MEWVEYKLKCGVIGLTDCPMKRLKMDGSVKKVGSTACMLCESHRGKTFYDDGSGGLVKCAIMKSMGKDEKPTKRGGKVKPSLKRKEEKEKKRKEEKRARKKVKGNVAAG